MSTMPDSVPIEISAQVSDACGIIERHLSVTLLAVHLYGSAVDGGLKPHSDIDLLVTVSKPPVEAVRHALSRDLLPVSRWPGTDPTLRSLEVTVIVHGNVVPWRYPARRELQFGEWLRKAILAGKLEPAGPDIDLTILLANARQHSIALIGPPAGELFDPVPEHDLFSALADTLDQWNSPVDWAGDERNIVLTLARMWYSAATGKIVPKDTAADWALERAPVEYHPVLTEACQAYLGRGEDRLAAHPDRVEAVIRFLKSAIADQLGPYTT